ncbi:hypothetical protein KDK95_08765 [Actinospica sp. MGRD01-02]|uniref:Teneurin-1 n=1 Tax=Actinospica acidithermotolerans TaxID=2828514 RepID=A0A941IK53_9ACTN|nr:LamG-like jellyroll fold domain-containing protein [Actinospica acidithermotolerans]MBR7826391.1 hypothetical protein [Actinospica acidithermotolerans]
MWTRRRLRLVAVIVSALMVLGVATQSATAEQLTPGRLPIGGVVRLVKSMFEDAVSVILPRQLDGRALTSHATAAGRGSGHAPGTGLAQAAAAGNGSPTNAKPGRSGSITRGFDARTSKLDQARTNATQAWYKNADGTLTERASQTPINFKDASGHWRPIDDSLVAGSGGYTNKAASFGLRIASSSGASHGARSQLASGVMRQDASSSASPTESASATPSASASATADPSDTASASATATPSPAPSIGSSSTGDLVTLMLGSGESFGWSLDGAADVAGTESGTTVTYSSILPETNVEVTSEDYGVKEGLTLDSASAGNSWTFDLSMSGLSLAQASDGTWQLADSSGNVVADLEQPYATDASGTASDPEPAETQAVTYSLATVGGVEKLTMTLDQSWLDDPSRVFPVTVDPTVNADINGQEETTYTSSEFPTANNDSSMRMVIGYDSSTGQQNYSYLMFPTSTMVHQGYHISSAQFAAFAYAQSNTASAYASFTVGAPNSAWSESGINWDNQPSSYQTLGAWSGSTGPTGSVTEDGTSYTGEWTYTNLSTTWLNDLQWNSTASYYGLEMIASSYSDMNYRKWFTSSLYSGYSPYVSLTYTPDAKAVTTLVSPVSGTSLDTLTPTLTVSNTDSTSWSGATTEYQYAVYKVTGTSSTAVATAGPTTTSVYVVPSGKLTWGNTYEWEATAYNGYQWGDWSALSSFSTTAPPPILTGSLSQNTNGHGFDAAIGNYTTSATDADITGAGPSLSLVRDYNSLDARSAEALGQGWSSMLDAKVTQVLSAAGKVTEAVVTYPDGQQVAFGLDADGTTYSPPQGRYASLTFSSSGYVLVDKDGTSYNFTHTVTAAASGVAGVYALTSIANHEKQELDYSWTATSGGQINKIVSSVTKRYVTIGWATPAGAANSHVSTVVTNDATGTDGTTAQKWTYNYTGDWLTSVCAPSQTAPATSTSACTVYNYHNGSVYQLAVSDSGANQYWPLDDASGTASATTLEAANVGNGTITYSNVTLGGSSHLTSSSATSAVFTATSKSYAELPNSLLTQSSDESIGLWFETTGTSEVLVDMGGAPVTSSGSDGYDPALYIGKDGKLVSELWTGDAYTPMESGSAVNDGKWHFAMLSASGATNEQYLYVDGKQVASKQGTISLSNGADVSVGAGWMGGTWPDDSLSGASSAVQYFTGSISDVAYYDRALAATDVAGLNTAGTTSSAQLYEITRPNHAADSAVAPEASIGYDTITGRVNSVTDANGGTWGIGLPSAYGSSYVYRAAIDAYSPQHVWKLSDASGATTAADDMNNDAWYGSTAGYANYNSVTLGTSGTSAMPGWTGASFDGSSSYVELPDGALNSATNTTTKSDSTSVTIGVWFQTTGTSQVLVGTGGAAVTSSGADGYDPALYIGKDGKLVSELWTGDAYTPLESSDTVNNGAWHFAMLVGDAANSKQYLYVDGKEVASKSGTISMSSTYVSLGAGWMGGSWPDDSLSGDSAAVQYFKGSMADVALYRSALTEDDVAAIWQAYKNSKGYYDPVEAVKVTDPADSYAGATHDEVYYYDPQNGMREVRYTSGLGESTTYGYDTNGFLNTTVDPNGDETITGHDARGNEVSQTTCQLQSQNKCSTSYKTYYWTANSLAYNSTDVRADLVTASSDGRSTSASDTTYQTKYTYNSNGDELTSADPLSRVTANTYTDGTTAFPSCDAPTTGAPTGLLATTTTSGGAVTRYTYYADGDTCTITNADGLVTYFKYDGLGRLISKTTGEQRVALLPLTDAAGSSTAADSSGLGNSGTETSVTFNGSYASFPGSSGQGIKIGSPVLTTNASYTLSAWVDLTSTPSTYAVVASVKGSSGTAAQIMYSTYDGLDRFIFQNTATESSSPTWYSAEATASPSTSTWYHLVAVYDAANSTDEFYINGTLVGTASSVQTWAATAGAFWIGSDEGSSDFPGYIKNVQAYQRALSSTEVSTLYGEGSAGAAVSDPAGEDAVAGYSYDGQGHLATSAAPSVTDRVSSAVHTAVTTLTYDDDGNLKTSTTADTTGGDTSRETQYAYNIYDQVQTKTDPDQHATNYTYDLFGNVETSTDPMGRETKTLYDAANYKRMQYLEGTTETGTATNSSSLLEEKWTYDAAGRLSIDTVDPNGLDYSTTYAYYDNGLTYQVAKTDGTSTYVESTSTYDGAGNLLTQATDNGVTNTDYSYDDAGQKLQVTVDPSGVDRVTAYTYTADGKVKETTVTGVTDAAGDRGTVSDETKTYDELDNITSTSVIDGSNTYTTKDIVNEQGLVTEQIDPLGYPTYYSYDEAGHRVVTTSTTVTATTYTAASGATVTAGTRAVTSTGYNTFGDEVETVDADGNETKYSYDNDSLLTAKILPSYTTPCAPGATSCSSTSVPSETTYQYYNDGNVQTITDPIAYNTSSAAGETINYTYNQLGKVATVQVDDYVSGKTLTTSYTYDALGRVTETTDPNNAQTSTVYDYLSRQTYSTVVDRHAGTNDSTTASYTTDYLYTDTGGWLSEQKSESTSSYTTYGYDNVGERISTTNAANDTTTTSYDGTGQAVKTVAPDLSYVTETYDEAGRKTATAEFATDKTQVGGGSFTYDADGRVATSTQIQSSTVSATTTYRYDGTGLLTSVTQPVDSSSSDAITIAYGYDLAGNKTAYTPGNGTTVDSSGNVTTNSADTTYTTYNSRGLPEFQVEPATSAYTAASDLTTTSTYDADGDLVTRVEPGQVTLAYSYDGRGDVLTESGTGAETPSATRSFTYDLDGNVLTAATSNTLSTTSTATATTTSTSNATSENFQYNDRGELIVAGGSAGSSSFSYTGDGLMASRTDASGTTDYTYDTSDRPYTVTDASTGSTLTYSYNTDSQVSQISYGTGADQELLGYNTAHELASDELETAAGTAMDTLSYGYDEAGDLTSKTDSTGTTNAYTYDEAGRITSWTAGTSTSAYSGNGTCTNSSTLTCYSYDKDSNRTESGANVYTYNSQDELTSDGVDTYQYTARGTQSSKASTSSAVSYQDDAYGQQDTAGVGQYTYDASGRLISQQNTSTGATTTLAYSGGSNLVASDGTTTYSRYANGALLGETTAATSALVWTDQHTDVVGTFTSSGTALTGTESYNPLGKVLTNTGTTASLSAGYQSEWTDTSTGEVNMAARWYNPATGQFTSKDTVSNSAVPNTAAANPFGYADGSPLDGADPSGHMRMPGSNFWSQFLSMFQLSYILNFARVRQEKYQERKLQDEAFPSLVPATPIAPSPTAQAAPSAHADKANKAGQSGTPKPMPSSTAPASGYANTPWQEVIKLVGKQVLIGAMALGTCDSAITAAVCGEVAADQEAALEAAAEADEMASFYGAEPGYELGGSISLKAFNEAENALNDEISAQEALMQADEDAMNASASTPKDGSASKAGSAKNGAGGTGSGDNTVTKLGSRSVTTGAKNQAIVPTEAAPSPAEAAPVAAEQAPATAAAPAAPEAVAPEATASTASEIPSSAETVSDQVQQDVPDLEENSTGCPSEVAEPHSFIGSTPVLMADGTTKQIDRIKAGDKITDSVPGQASTQVNAVTKVITTYTDHDFVTLTVAPLAPDGSTGVHKKLARSLATVFATFAAAIALTNSTQQDGSLTTTYHHPFYDITRQQFVQAEYLKPGDQLQTSAGRAVVTGVKLYHADTTTYDLTIGDLHTYYVLAGDTPVLVQNCGGSIARHSTECTCSEGGEPLGVSPTPGNTVVLGLKGPGNALADSTEGGMTFNAGDEDMLYGYFHDLAEPQWVREVRSAIENPAIEISVDLGGLPAEPGSTAMDIFQAAAGRGMKAGSWRNGPGTDWEMRQIQIAAYDDPGLAGRINWFLNGVDVNGEMAGSLLPTGNG